MHGTVPPALIQTNAEQLDVNTSLSLECQIKIIQCTHYLLISVSLSLSLILSLTYSRRYTHIYQEDMTKMGNMASF